jgi:hypothetical protein
VYLLQMVTGAVLRHVVQSIVAKPIARREKEVVKHVAQPISPKQLKTNYAVHQAMRLVKRPLR